MSRRGDPKPTSELSNPVQLGAVCKEGTSGVLCGLCSENYVLQSDGQCKQCNANTDLILLWVLVGLVVLLCLAIGYCVLNSIRKRCNAGSAEERQADSAMVDVDATDSATELKNQVLAQWAASQALAGPLKIMIGLPALHRCLEGDNVHL